MEPQKRICGLCLKICDDYKAIEGDMKNIVDKVLPKIDLAAIQEPVMCTYCTETVIKCFDFKAACFCTYDNVVPLVNKNKVKLDIRNVCLSKNVNGISILKNQDVCGFCRSPVKICSAISLAVAQRDVILEKMIEQCLPELDLSIIEKPVICASCHESLGNCFRFVTNCSVVEEKIKKYCKTLDVNSRGQIDLSRFLQFTMTNVTGEEVGNRVNTIKVEEQFCEDSENAIGKIDHENESYMNMNCPKFNDEQQYSSENMLAFKVESNKLNEIKMEETLCGKNGIKDLQFSVNEETEMKTCEQDFNRKDRIELSGLLQFTMKTESSNVDDNSVNIIKVEKQLCDDSENAVETFDCNDKSFMGTNNPRFDVEKQYSSENMLPCKKESTDFDVMKIEKTFFRGNGSKLNEENLIGMEDQKFLVKEEIEIKTDGQDFDSFENDVLPQPEGELACIKDTSTKKMSQCGTSSYQTQYKVFLEKHLLTHKDPYPEPTVTMYTCDTCSFQTKHKDYLTSHLLIHKGPSEVTMYKCDSCSYQTKRKDKLRTHLQIHRDPSEVTMYKCDSCPFQTRHKNYLNRHLLIHKDPSEVTMHECDFCPYQSKYKDCLKSHLQVHKDPLKITMYKCDSCSFQTKRKSYLNRHLLLHKDPSEITIYKCDSCLFQTKDKRILKRHLLVHKGPLEITMYRCDSCSFQTRHKYYLKMHLLIHKDPSELTMFKCSSCSFQTKHKYILKKHLLVHKGPSEVTMYKCNSCSFQTRHKHSLPIHLLLHKSTSEVTMHKCDSCPFQTKYKNHLKTHILLHKSISEVTMHKCDLCSFQTIYKSHLKTHLLVHRSPSEVTMYKCDFCPFQTKNKPYLNKKHLPKHNNLIIQPSQGLE